MNTQHDSLATSAILMEFLASRICHDLISPVGAVHNGVEFLEDMGSEVDPEALALIAYSASQASAKLQCFRMCYGAGGRDPNIKPADVQKAFAELIDADKKFTQDWDPYADLGFGEDRPLGYCKTLMGCLMLAQECLPRGGKISVMPHETGQETLIVAEGQDDAPHENYDRALTLDIAPENLDPRLVHPYAVSVIARSCGLSVRLTNIAPGRVVISLASDKSL